MDNDELLANVVAEIDLQLTLQQFHNSQKLYDKIHIKYASLTKCVFDKAVQILEEHRLIGGSKDGEFHYHKCLPMI